MSQRRKGTHVYLNADEVELLILMTSSGNYGFESEDVEADIQKENAARSINRKLRGV